MGIVVKMWLVFNIQMVSFLLLKVVKQLYEMAVHRQRSNTEAVLDLWPRI